MVSEAEIDKIFRCQNSKIKELTKYDKRKYVLYMWYNGIQRIGLSQYILTTASAPGIESAAKKPI